jgi:hypothetical protein
MPGQLAPIYAIRLARLATSLQETNSNAHLRSRSGRLHEHAIVYRDTTPGWNGVAVGELTTGNRFYQERLGAGVTASLLLR